METSESEEPVRVLRRNPPRKCRPTNFAATVVVVDQPTGAFARCPVVKVRRRDPLQKWELLRLGKKRMLQ